MRRLILVGLISGWLVGCALQAEVARKMGEAAYPRYYKQSPTPEKR
jgi:hypothetical protein